jgi:hypothetical protein
MNRFFAGIAEIILISQSLAIKFLGGKMYKDIDPQRRNEISVRAHVGVVVHLVIWL